MKNTAFTVLVGIFLACRWANALPWISEGPADTSVSPGATVQFTVTASVGSGTLSYQWWFNNAPLDAAVKPSAASRRLSLTNVALADAGSYFVVVTDGDGSATSQVATLTVDSTFTKIMKGALVEDRLSSICPLWGDYDNDGRLDVLVGGPPNQWRLYHNDGGTLFSAVTNGVMSQRSVLGMEGAWGDPNNDGGLDFYAGTFVQAYASGMYWSDGHGNFVRQPVGPSWTSNKVPLRGRLGCWGDFDRDGFLDAFIRSWTASGLTETNSLLHNSGDGTFVAVTNSVLAIENDGILAVCAVDYDNDGNLDLVLVRGAVLPSELYHNDGQGVFTEATPEPMRSEVTYSYDAAWADFDNDGDLDVIFGGLEALPERFYINNGDGTFSPWAGQPDRFEGVDFPSGYGGSEIWGDYDDDGYLDLLAWANAHWRLWRNLGNSTFEEILTGSPVTDSAVNSEGASWTDFNNDGFLDLFVANAGGNVNYLYMNNANTNHWLEVKLQGTMSDRMAVGTKIFATATIRGNTMRQMRVITANNWDQTLVAHFGLGDAANVDLLRIEWPLGLVQEIPNVAANQILTVTEHQAGDPHAPNLAVSNSADGTLQLTATGDPNFRYVFEASTNLVQWTKIAVRTNLTGTVECTPAPASLPQRFYRVQVP